MLADGAGVRLGDIVATEDGEGPIVAVTATGYPIIEVTSGRRTGSRPAVRHHRPGPAPRAEGLRTSLAGPGHDDRCFGSKPRVEPQVLTRNSDHRREPPRGGSHGQRRAIMAGLGAQVG
ncbi:hypothetical protein [Catellatospora methionotrophica]|uniref:hypothetical protein n=1 Tax=Catellatospora methionotrophica TaxID=121620 RepID=UPI00140C97E0|nr:hypothetical protein [Catellatospora methionotrophica]